MSKTIKHSNSPKDCINKAWWNEELSSPAMEERIALNLLGPIAPNVVIILSASSCDFRQCPWEIHVGSATAERAGQGEVGGCTRRVQTAWPCLGSAVERSWSALGGPFPSFLA